MKATRELQSAPRLICCWNSWQYHHSRHSPLELLRCQLNPRDEALRAVEKLNLKSICIFLNNLSKARDRKISNLKFCSKFSLSWLVLVDISMKSIKQQKIDTFHEILSRQAFRKASRRRIEEIHEKAKGKGEKNEWKLADSWICKLVEFFFLECLRRS